MLSQERISIYAKAAQIQEGDNMARNPGTKVNGQPFDEATIEAVWQKGTPEPQYPGFRKDRCGASMQKGRNTERLNSGAGRSITRSQLTRAALMIFPICNHCNGKITDIRVTIGQIGIVRLRTDWTPPDDNLPSGYRRRNLEGARVSGYQNITNF
jgi:hypothetical protein